MAKITLGDDNYCFACGKKNRVGLQLEFNLIEGNKIQCEFMPKKEHQGFADIVHGGIIALILDEAMVNLIWKLGKKAVTSEFGMRLKKAAFVGSNLFFSAEIERETKKVFYTRSFCKDVQGEIIASGFAKCIRI